MYFSDINDVSQLMNIIYLISIYMNMYVREIYMDASPIRLIFSFDGLVGLGSWYYFVGSLNNEKRAAIFNNWISTCKLNRDLQILSRCEGIGSLNKRIELDPASGSREYIELRHREIHMTTSGAWSQEEINDLIDGFIKIANSYSESQNCKCQQHKLLQ
jgi:hypothetical protein